MNDRITRYIQKLKAEKKKQKQAAAFITAMSLVVSGTVSWQLHGIGTAMIDENLTEKQMRTYISCRMIRSCVKIRRSGRMTCLT